MTAEKIHAPAPGLLSLVMRGLFSLPTPLRMRAGQALISGQYLSGAGQDIQLANHRNEPIPHHPDCDSESAGRHGDRSRNAPGLPPVRMRGQRRA